jgi:hypothetical protein
MKVGSELLKEAKDWGLFKSNKYTVYKQNKDTQNEFQIMGNLGELTFQKMFPQAERISNKDYEADFIVNNKRIDVKTKIGYYEFQTHWNVHVQEHQKDWNLDWYVFFYYSKNAKELEYLGGISKVDFFKHCKLIQKGDLFDNGHKVHQNQYALSTSKLIL